MKKLTNSRRARLLLVGLIVLSTGTSLQSQAAFPMEPTNKSFASETESPVFVKQAEKQQSATENGTPKNEAESKASDIEGNILLKPESNSAEEGKRHSALVKRTILYPGSDLEFGGGNGPFCYDRYVTGNCRYRTDPEYCYQYEWTAYAIVQTFGGGIESDPPGLLVTPGTQDRVRVWVKTSCCTPDVRILTTDPYNKNINACVVDVRELQGLHPGEIAGIVLGVIVLLIIIIAVIALVVRKRKREVVTAEVTQTRGNKRVRDSTGVSIN